MPKKKQTRKQLARLLTQESEQSTKSPRNYRRIILISAVALGIALVSAAVYLAVSRKPGIQSSSLEYVDSATCTGCHQSEASSFQHTGMAHSVYKPNATNMVEDFDAKNAVFHQPSGNYYTMVHRADGYYQQRYQIGFDGKPANAAEERIDYVIGSGDLARSYLHRTAEGKLMELPVSWYSENKGYWAMTPGYEDATQKDFHGTASKGCIFCHNAYPQVQSDVIEATGEPIFPSELPQGIDCQRCHGPGGAHVKAATARKPNEERVHSTIVNPANLSRERQMDVCMQCHLSTSESQDENISQRAGRGVYSYQPGTMLADYKLYFDEIVQDKKGFPIADAAYRLRMSSCFRSSEMTCLTCHDPHEESHSSKEQQSYIAVCEGCHQGVKHSTVLPARDNCLSCHMPKRRGEYAIHTVLTDHYIQREKPPGNLLAPVNSKRTDETNRSNALKLYYPEALPNDGRMELDLAAANSIISADPTQRISRLETAIRKFSPPQASYYAALGRAYASAGDSQNALIWFEQAVQRDPANHGLTGELVEVLIATGNLERSQELLERLIATPPPVAREIANLGNIYARRGNFASAELTLQRALAVDPELAQAYNLLGTVKEKVGDARSAEGMYRNAIRLRPDLAEARTNLAKLLMAGGHTGEAEFEFKQSITSAPRIAETHHSYGLLLMLNRAYPQAETELRASITLEPREAVAHSDLANLLVQVKKSKEATEQYREALMRDPTLGEANLGLGLLLFERGEKEEGRKLCEKAEHDAEPSIQLEAHRCLQQK